MGVRIKYNYLGSVARELEREIEDCVGDVADQMADELKGTLWVDTGMVRRVTTDRGKTAFSAEVVIGYNRGHGFYSRFNEWGTVKQRARPIVGPTAHRYEEVLTREMTAAIRKACAI